MYKGNLPKGSKVQAELSCDTGNKGTALLTLSYANDDDETSSSVAKVAPGGTNQAQVTTSAACEGTIKVWADLADDNSDKGTLTVQAGNVTATQSFTGDQIWTFSVL